MAEPIGLASGLLALSSFAFKSSITLYKTVQSFQNHPKRVRDLEEELGALSAVLGSLADTISANTKADFSALELPLLRCGNACQDFEKEIVKCSARTGSNRTSFRDWARLRYMGDDIDGFRQLLAGYKLTINIALTDANLRKSSITAEALEGYRDLIKTATDDLEAHLQSIDDKLENIFGNAATSSASDTTELRLIKEERTSAKKCLQICAQLASHIDEIDPTPQRSSPRSVDQSSLPEIIISEGLQECKDSIILTAAKLERLLKDRVTQLVTKSKLATTEEDLANLLRLQEEWETARQCMDICHRADTHLKANITTIDNYATGDALQFMVSTDGKIIHGKNRGLGWRTRQVGGHLSDATVQQLSRDLAIVNFRSIEDEDRAPRSNCPESLDGRPQNKPDTGFGERYGPGFRLTSRIPVDTPISCLPKSSPTE